MNGIWEMITRGGIIMIPLILTSVIGLAVVIERMFFLRHRRILRPELIQLIQNIKNLSDIKNCLMGLKNQDGPFQNIIRLALENDQKTKQEVKELILDQGRQEARVLERGLVILETIAGISPLLGLLGTVLGMIKVFQVVSEQGLGQTQALSGGISEALITTVVGLTIAIPTLIAYNYFTHRVEDLILEIEKYTTSLMDRLECIRK